MKTYGYTQKIEEQGTETAIGQNGTCASVQVIPLFARKQEVVDLPAIETTWLSVPSLLAPMLSCSGCGLCLVMVLIQTTWLGRV